jgi:hypothetical protein
MTKGRRKAEILTGSSISVSVSPAHSWPGVVQIVLTLSRPRDEAYEDTLPKMRIRKLVVDFDLKLWTLLVGYGMSSSSRSSSLSLFSCICVDMNGCEGYWKWEGKEGEEFDFGLVNGRGVYGGGLSAGVKRNFEGTKVPNSFVEQRLLVVAGDFDFGVAIVEALVRF